MRRCKFGRRADGKCRKTPRRSMRGRLTTLRGLGEAAGERTKKSKVKRQPATGRGRFCVTIRKPGAEKGKFVSSSECFSTPEAAFAASQKRGSVNMVMLYSRKNPTRKKASKKAG
jgi:hypothetical protein